MQAILESGRLADLRDGDLTRVSRDEFRKTMGLMSLTSEPEPLLKFIRTIAILPTKKFFARNHFMVDTRGDAPVRISDPETIFAGSSWIRPKSRLGKPAFVVTNF